MSPKEFYRCSLSDHFSSKQILLARIYASNVNIQCSKAAKEEGYFPPHMTADKIRSYRKRNLDQAKNIRAGLLDHNFTIRQRMEVHLLGTCTALLA